MTYHIIKMIWLKTKIKCERHMRFAATRGHLASIIYLYIFLCIAVYKYQKISVFLDLYEISVAHICSG
jgi:hypothetical protein